MKSRKTDREERLREREATIQRDILPFLVSPTARIEDPPELQERVAARSSTPASSPFFARLGRN